MGGIFQFELLWKFQFSFVISSPCTVPIRVNLVFRHALPVRFPLIRTVLRLLKHLSLLLRISFNLLGGGYGYFLALYNILLPTLDVIISTSKNQIRNYSYGSKLFCKFLILFSILKYCSQFGILNSTSYCMSVSSQLWGSYIIFVFCPLQAL